MAYGIECDMLVSSKESFKYVTFTFGFIGWERMHRMYQLKISRTAISKTMTVGIIAIIIVAAIGAGGYLYLRNSTPATVDKVYFSLDWLPRPYHMHYYVAKNMFWPGLGIDVTIVRGTGSGDTALKVGMGVAQFGTAGLDAAVDARASQSLLVKAIWSVLLQTDNGLLFIANKDNGRGVIDPNNLKTLEGKILGEPSSSGMWAQFPAFCNIIGVNISRVTHLSVDPSAKVPLLINGDIDFMATSVGDSINPAAIKSALPDAQVVQVFFKDVGFKMMGDVVITSDQVLSEKPDLVRRFVEGLSKGFAWTAENIDKAIDIFISYNSEYEGKQANVKSYFVDMFKPLSDKSVIAAHGTGYMPPDIIQQSVENTYVIYGITSRKLPSWDEIYTNEFIRSDIVPTTWPW